MKADVHDINSACYLYSLCYVEREKYGFDGASVLAVIVLFSILINVTIVSTVIFCQSRYTIYNMPLFYISGVVLWTNIMKKRNSTSVI